MSLRSEFTALIKDGCTIKLLGDSLTIGSGSSDSDLTGAVIYHPFYRQKGRLCWASLLTEHLIQYGCTVDNMGCYGTTSDEMMEHWDVLYQPTDTLVFCMIGANDKKVVQGMEHLERNLRTVCDRILSDGNHLILMTPNPATATNDAKANRLYPQAAVAQVIRRVWADYADRVLIIDNHAAMEAECVRRGITMDEFLQVGAGPENDGLHPGDEAYRFYFSHICRELEL